MTLQNINNSFRKFFLKFDGDGGWGGTNITNNIKKGRRQK